MNEISLHGNMWSVNPSVLWQQLFNLYRDGGNLDFMQNMLIDYENCKQVFDQVNKDKNIVFIFGFDCGKIIPNTMWLWEKDFWKDQLNLQLQYHEMDNCFKFVVSEEKIVWERL